MTSLDRNAFHRSSTPMPLSARAVPRRFSPRRVSLAPSEVVDPAPLFTSWTDRVKRTVWDRISGWVRRRADEWIHRNLDQLLPEPVPNTLPNLPPYPRPSDRAPSHACSSRPSLFPSHESSFVVPTSTHPPQPNAVDAPESSLPFSRALTVCDPPSDVVPPNPKRRRLRPPTPRGGDRGSGGVSGRRSSVAQVAVDIATVP